MIDLIKEHAGVDVHPSQPVEELRKICDDLDVPYEPQWGSGKLVLEIYEKTTEHAIVGPTFVCDYPREVSPLAREHRDDPDPDRAVRSHRRRPRARERVQRAERSGRPAAAVRGAGRPRAARRRRSARRRRRLRARARVRPPADGRHGHGRRPARDDAGRRRLDPRGDPLPAPAPGARRPEHQRGPAMTVKILVTGMGGELGHARRAAARTEDRGRPRSSASTSSRPAAGCAGPSSAASIRATATSSSSSSKTSRRTSSRTSACTSRRRA